MAQNSGAFLENQHKLKKAMGDLRIASDFQLVPDGFEHMRFLCKTAPAPVASSRGEIEVAAANGSILWQMQQYNFGAQQGAISFTETEQNHYSEFQKAVIASKGKWNGWIYQGTVEKFIKAYRIEDCAMVVEPGELDIEGRGTILQYTGTLFYHWYGTKDKVGGNSYE